MENYQRIGSGGGIWTPDTRIIIPLLGNRTILAIQKVTFYIAIWGELMATIASSASANNPSKSQTKPDLNNHQISIKIRPAVTISIIIKYNAQVLPYLEVNKPTNLFDAMGWHQRA